MDITDLFGPHVWPLYLHFVGDYVLQSDWMANNKTRAWAPALAHAFMYTVPFLVLTQSWPALLFIFGTHLVIDHWKLARYVCWAKNFLAPRDQWPRPWSECTATGYNPGTPVHMATWLMIITDNVMHVACNAWALRYL